jgi:hypothetical protein
MKKRIDLVINGKGGVGKSFFTINLVQYLKDHGTEFVAVDTDNENSTLKRFHSDAVFADISKPQSIDSLFSNLENHSLLIVDCRAASTDIFLDYFDELSIFDVLKEMNASMTVVSPVNHEPDSVKQLQVLSERLNERCDYVIVKNHSLSEEFVIYEKSKTRGRLLKDFKAQEIDMPKLQDWLVVGLNQAGCPLTPALRSPHFSVLNRQRLKNWQKRFYEQVDSVGTVLMPEASSKQTPTKAGALL